MCHSLPHIREEVVTTAIQLAHELGISPQEAVVIITRMEVATEAITLLHTSSHLLRHNKCRFCLWECQLYRNLSEALAAWFLIQL